MNYTQKIIDEHLTAIPSISRKAIESINIRQVVQQIGHDHGLLIEEMNELYMMTVAMLSGLDNPNLFEEHLKEEFSLSKDTAIIILHKLRESIFEPAHKKLLELQKEPPHPSEQDLLSEIEDKSKPQQTNVTHKKLADIFAMPPAKSDYSVDKPVKPVSYEGDDPYHEPID